jgi:hypothetical protein
MARKQRSERHGFFEDYRYIGTLWGWSPFRWFRIDDSKSGKARRGYKYEDRMQMYGSDSDILAEPYACTDERGRCNSEPVRVDTSQEYSSRYTSERPRRKRQRLQLR